MDNHCKNTPLLSVIIPARNEEQSITGCLDNIISNDYPENKLEIIVVDGKSSDNTVSALQNYTKKHREIKILENPKKITPAALNIGVKHATGSIVAVVGAHNYISDNYLSTAVRYLRDNNADCVGGIGVCIPANKNLMAKAISLAVNNKFGVGSSFRTNYPKEIMHVDTVASPVYKKEVFKKNELFDEDLLRTQDSEFNARLIKNGGKILLVPEITSYYYARDSLAKLWKMNLQYGYFKPLAAKKIGKILALRQLVPPLFVGSLIVSLVLSMIFKPFLWLFFFILGSYITANLAFSLRIALKEGVKYFFALPFVFATIHFSWGIGCLKGIWDFIILKRKPTRRRLGDITLTR